MTKREVWEAIKKDCPETAKYIHDLAEVFGKLERVIIVPRETRDKK